MLLAPEKTNLTVLEQSVPIHLMYLTCENLTRSGWQLRQDTLDAVNKASLLPFVNMAEYRVSYLARETDVIARKVLDNISMDHPQQYVLSVCFLILILVQEGVWRDPRHVIVLTALGMIDEAKDHSDWLFDERKMQFEGKHMFTRLRLEGLFLPRNVIV